jgi:hypothetical protein
MMWLCHLGPPVSEKERGESNGLGFKFNGPWAISGAGSNGFPEALFYFLFISLFFIFCFSYSFVDFQNSPKSNQTYSKKFENLKPCFKTVSDKFA